MPGTELRFRSVVLRLGSPARDKPCAVQRHRAPERGSSSQQPSFQPLCGVGSYVESGSEDIATQHVWLISLQSVPVPVRPTHCRSVDSGARGCFGPFGAGVPSRAPREPVQDGRRGSVPAAPIPGLHAGGAATDRTAVGRGSSRSGASTGSMAARLHSCPWMPRFSPA